MTQTGGGVFGRMRMAAGAAGLALGLGLLPHAATGQEFRFNTVQITGNQRIESPTILTYAGITRGEAVTAGQLNDAAQRIRASGLFSRVDLVPRGGTLVIEVQENPTINAISFEGNARLRNEELAGVIASVPRRVYSATQAEADVAAIVAAYADRGRINATVRPVIIERADNRVDLVFEITEGAITEIERISFVGNRAFSAYRLRLVLETKQAGVFRALVGRDTFIADRIEVDREALREFYLSRGYVDFAVQNVDVALTRERDAYLITFNLQEGQQFRFGNVTVTSEIPEADAEAYRAAIRLRPGVVYSPEVIETDIARMERLAIRQGVDFLTVEPRITRNARDLTLDIDYVLVRGDRRFIERIDIEGNNTTLDRVVRNQFRLVEGDPLNAREIRESADRIRRLGFFSDVRVRQQPGSRPDQTVIDVNVEEAPTGSLSFGANFSTDNGFALVASFSERNFLGRGQALDFNLSTGENNRLFAFDFTEPAFLGRDLRFSLNTQYRTTQRANALYDTETFRFSPAFQFPVSEQGRLTLFYAAEYTDITNVAGVDTPDDATDDASIVVQNEAALGGIWTNSLGYSYSFDTRRSGLNPNAGVLLRFGQEFGFGDTQFVKTTALASAETRVMREDVTLRATLEGGMLNYLDGDSRVTDRYFLGSRVMRGFEPGGIGPRDADSDDALGGDLYAVLRLETEFPLGLPEEYGITGGAFIDYGSVWDVGETYGADVLYNDFTPRTVAGVSIFWDTPIGPLRFNFTEPLEREEFDRPRNFDLTISTRF